MYRLLIADDEESIREGVADFVRRTARNGMLQHWRGTDARRWRWRGRFCPMRC